MFPCKKHVMAVFFAALFMGAISTAHAQYVGPGSEMMRISVQEILNKPQDGQLVILRGYIVRKHSRNQYDFMDDTATIRAEIDEKHFFNRKIDERTGVGLFGKVDLNDEGRPEIEVRKLNVLSR